MANTTNTSSEAPAMICPVCGKSFNDIHVFAFHINEHSQDEKRRKAEEEKQRKADQKKVDYARLENLKKIYEDASNNYIKAKEKYAEDYGENYDGDFSWDKIVRILNDYGTNNKWGHWW